jgi:hypothetical protein
MTTTELKQTIQNVQTVLDNALNAIQTTDIPAYVLIHYIKQETGIDMENVTTGRE